MKAQGDSRLAIIKVATRKLPVLPLARPTADCRDGGCGCGCGVPISR